MKAPVVSLAALIILLISQALADDDQKVNFNFFSFFLSTSFKVAFILLLNSNTNYFHLETSFLMNVLNSCFDIPKCLTLACLFLINVSISYGSKIQKFQNSDREEIKL